MRRFRKIFRSEAGFTLIELLVVIAVLGILAGIAIPRLTGVKDKAYLTEAQSALSVLRQAQEMYYVEKGIYTSNLSDLYEYVDQSSLPTRWDYSFTVTNLDNTPNSGDETFTIEMDGNGTEIKDEIGASIDQDGTVNTSTSGEIDADD